MNRQEALQYVKGMMDQGMSSAQANTELVRKLDELDALNVTVQRLMEAGRG